MNGSDFIVLADHLVKQKLGPSGYRSAVSRAYYGCYHLARDVLKDFGWYCRDRANEHLWVQWHFENCTIATFVAIGKSLANLHQSRKHADYDLDKAFAETEANALTGVVRAERIKSEIAAATNGANKDVMRAEMDAYRKKLNMT